jgi:hypothetical protein
MIHFIQRSLLNLKHLQYLVLQRGFVVYTTIDAENDLQTLCRKNSLKVTTELLAIRIASFLT